MKADDAFTPDYGRALGVLTPQANTTVEPEMQLLLEGSVLSSRLTSPLSDSRARLIDYFDQLQEAIARFDVAPIAATGFACTGSAYLVGADEEQRRIEAASAAAGHPVVSAASAIRAALEAMGATRIALLSPYPSWLSQAGQVYWRSAGFTLTAVAGLPADLADTRGIYRLTTARVAEILGSLDTTGADAVLLSGTGMPSLRSIARSTGRPPMLSSNLCLAWAMTRAAGGAADLAPWLAADARWRARLVLRDAA